MSEADPSSGNIVPINQIVGRLRSEVTGVASSGKDGAAQLSAKTIAALDDILTDLLYQFRKNERRPCQIKTKSIMQAQVITTEAELAAAINKLSPSQLINHSPRLVLANQTPAPIENSPLVASLFTEPTVDLTIIKPEKFVCRPMFARGRVTGTAAPGGVGKSLIALYEAASIAMGINPYDGSQIEPQRVLYWNLENTSDGSTMRRIAAFCKRHPDMFKIEQLRANLIIAGPERGDLKFAYTERGGVVVNDATVAWLIEQIQGAGVALAVFDPLASLHAIEENDNGGMDRLAKQGFAKIAREADCAVHIVHHSGKGLDRNCDPTDMFRGASSITSAFRVTRAVYKLSNSQALAEGIEPVDGADVLQMKFGKQNLVNGRECYPRYFRTEEVIVAGAPDDPNRVAEAAIRWVKPPPPRRVEFDNPADTVCRIISEGHYILRGQASPKWIGIGILHASGARELPDEGKRSDATQDQKNQVEAILMDLEHRDVIRKARKTVGTNSSDVWEVYPVNRGELDPNANNPW